MTDDTPLVSSATVRPLTDSDLWDDYWRELPALPTEVGDDASPAVAAIRDVLDRFAYSPAPISVLDIGGAPGRWVAHLHRRFGHEVCVLDSSPVGIAMTRKNFELLGIPGETLQRELFDLDISSPQFDLVYSLGLIEHFEDTSAAVAAHLSYVRPGGRLILGCPNLTGLSGALMRRLSPGVFDWHYAPVTDLRRWPSFEREFGLRVRFSGYVGGFQPGTFWRRERDRLLDRVVRRALMEADKRWNGRAARALSHVNSRHWSYYGIAVYDKPCA